MINRSKQMPTSAIIRRLRRTWLLSICVVIAMSLWVLSGTRARDDTFQPQEGTNIADPYTIPVGRRTQEPATTERSGRDEKTVPTLRAQRHRNKAEKAELKRRQDAAHALLQHYFLHTRARPEYCLSKTGVDIANFVAAYESAYGDEAAAARTLVSEGYYHPESSYSNMKELYLREAELDMHELVQASDMPLDAICAAFNSRAKFFVESYGPPSGRLRIGDIRRE